MGFTANRYTQYDMPKYTPRTLEELMVAPSYMRQQHDAMEASRAAAETEIAKYDALREHSDILGNEQARMYEELNNQAAALETQGFSNSAKSDFIRFNKDYQQSVGPQGKIGKVTSALNSWETEKARILGLAVNGQYGADQLQMKLDDARAKYSAAFNETGEVVDFEGPNAPKYQDLDKDIAAAKTALGSTTIENFRNGTFKVVLDTETGLPVLDDRTGTHISQKNKDNINLQIQALLTKYTGDGEGAMSLDWQGISEGDAISRIKDSMNASEISVERDNIKQNFTPLPGLMPEVPEQPEKPDISLLFLGDKDGLNPAYDMKYSDMSNRIDDLAVTKESGKMTPAQKTEYDQLVKHKTNIDNAAKGSEIYKDNYKLFEEIEAELIHAKSQEKDWSLVPGYDDAKKEYEQLVKEYETSPYTEANLAGFIAKNPVGEFKDNYISEIQERWDNSAAAVEEERNWISQGVKLINEDLGFDINTNAGEAKIKRLEGTLVNWFKLAKDNAGSWDQLEIVDFVDEKGNPVAPGETDFIKTKDSDTIKKALFNLVGEDKAELISFKPIGSKYPEYTVRIKPDAIEKMSLIGDNRFWENFYGSGNAFQVTFSMNSFGSSGLSNPNGKMVEMVGDMGHTGERAAGIMITQGILQKYFNGEATTWGTAMGNSATQNLPTLMVLYSNEIIRVKNNLMQVDKYSSFSEEKLILEAQRQVNSSTIL